MKKYNLLIALALFAGSVASSPATARAQAPAPAQDDKAAQQAEFERKWYDTCYTKKDNEQCYVQSKELIEKYPSSTYIKNGTAIVKVADQNKAWEKFQTALKAYYTAPQTVPKYDTLVTAGKEYYKFVPDEPSVVAQLAIAGHSVVLGAPQSKSMDGPKDDIEKALGLFETTTPPKEYKPEQWSTLRELVQAQGNQFLAYRLTETNGDQDKALEYLGKAIAVKGKDGAGWKDPFNYQLRSSIYVQKYQALSKQYEGLTDEQKTGDAGKELLKQVNSLLDTKILPEYARILATTGRPELKSVYDQT
jgi:tetratricopeptide (TPR) repeat protein